LTEAEQLAQDNPELIETSNPKDFPPKSGKHLYVVLQDDLISLRPFTHAYAKKIYRITIVGLLPHKCVVRISTTS